MEQARSSRAFGDGTLSAYTVPCVSARSQPPRQLITSLEVTVLDRRQGCLEGLLELLLLNWLFNWLQATFGFGRGASCTGCGCGLLLLIIFLYLACQIVSSTNWGRLTALLTSFV